MAACSLDRRGAHALGHEAFQIGMDGPILGGNDVPARFGFPCRAFDLLREQVGDRYGLSRPDELLLRLGQIAREIPDAVRLQPDPPIGDLDVGEDVGDGKLLLQALRGFVGIGR